MEIQLIFNLQKANAEWIYYKTLFEYMKTLYGSNNVGKDMLIISALVEVAGEEEEVKIKEKFFLLSLVRVQSTKDFVLFVD